MGTDEHGRRVFVICDNPTEYVRHLFLLHSRGSEIFILPSLDDLEVNVPIIVRPTYGSILFAEAESNFPEQKGPQDGAPFS